MSRSLLGRLRVPGGLLALLLLGAVARSESRPLFVCESACECDATMRPDCRACVWLTVANVPERIRTRFVAYVKHDGAWKAKDIAEGRSAPIAVEDEWTLVTMEIRQRGDWQVVCQKLLKRRCATCRLDYADPPSGEGVEKNRSN